MSKITVTTIAGQTSGADANKVKIESGDTLEVTSNATVGGTLGVTGTSVLTGNVGIGTSASTGNNPLVVQAGSGAGGINLHGRSSDNTATMLIGKSADGNTAYNTITSYANRMRIQSGFSSDTNTIEFFTNDVSRVVIDASGRVTMPGQPNFLARPNANDTIAYGSSKIAHDEAIHNIGNHYNTSNQRFTAPVAGIYYFEHIIVMTGGNSGFLEAKIHVNGVERSRDYHYYAGNQSSSRTSRTIQLAAADYVEPQCHWSNSNTNTLNSGSTAMMITSFSGYLMQ